jgi:CubicO group peptidase (beta-lactamase class C family)
MRKIRNIVVIVLVVLAWTAFVALGFTERFLLRSIDSGHTTEGFSAALVEKMETEFIGNLAMAMIENGQVKQTHFYSHEGLPIDAHSAFPVASISKWVTAVGILRLAEEGKLDLDQPVDDYLTRWHLPESEFDNSKVTARRLLSHSSGLVDDLGYGGFTPEEEMQTLEESLDKAADGDYSEGVARVGYEPGSQYMYSGASYTLLQLVIEEVSGVAFSDFIATQIFEPLGMANSSFQLSDSSKIGLVTVYRNDGSARPMNRFTAKAAASLMASVDDLSKFMIAQTSTALLSADMIRQMSSAESFRNGYAYYGLGPRVYTQNAESHRLIGHDGSGNNAINTAARLDMTSNDGIIILETGNYSFASDMADEWMFWQAGIADRVVMERNIPFLLTVLVIGYIFIIILLFIVIRKRCHKANES